MSIISHYSCPCPDVDSVLKNFAILLNPPRVTVDNTSRRDATVLRVHSLTREGCLLDVVQALMDLNLIIRRAYISSDGAWFMDVFHVTDQHGNKLVGEEVAEYVVKSLSKTSNVSESTNSVGIEATTSRNTSIELSDDDRPGFLSDVASVLTDFKCNIVTAEVWTHNSRVASVIHVTDTDSGEAIVDTERLSVVKDHLLRVLSHDMNRWTANMEVVKRSSTSTARRLHQIMHADGDHCLGDMIIKNPSLRPMVDLENCSDKGYTMIKLRSPDRPKLIFDVVCTLTDMKYAIFHGTVSIEGVQSYQEYYVRHKDGSPFSSEMVRQRLIQCLEAAIERRVTEGIRLELCGQDKIGLLSEVTQAFRENGLSVTRAEVTTRGSLAVNTFYVESASGDPVRKETIEMIRKAIGLTLVQVDDRRGSNNREEKEQLQGRLFRTKSEKLLHIFGLLKSCF